VQQATRNDNTKQKARKEIEGKKKKNYNANDIAKHNNAQCSQNANDQFFFPNPNLTP
jgi:hypothetical protein